MSVLKSVLEPAATCVLPAGYPIQPVQVAARDAAAEGHLYFTPRDFESASVVEVV